MGVEDFRFLEAWSLLLPERGCIAAAGHGGVTTSLLRVLSVYRQRGTRVLWTQTTPHPVPFELRENVSDADPDRARAILDAQGVVWVGGEPESSGRPRGLGAEEVAGFADAVGAEVVLVEAGQPTSGRLDPRGAAPVWPKGVQLSVCTANLGLVGRLWTEDHVVGAPGSVGDEGEEPRRVSTEDVIAALGRTLDSVPASARPLPFLTGMGAYRDVDGMFELVNRMWGRERVWVVAMAELLGDERRDAADLRGLGMEVSSSIEDGERIYAVYPASLDD